ncbi:short chain dehydrogenase [Aulographum hederae CBS 113979]|uniref:Short chain dehydrogenase n=1 Tax=Aulographum hederae CBS 113979 TaxID=1176131 RepID=A0A6G1HAE1_9PEZI|nr:short chain dehydrogenase [Aulographum hederae CBS 113979]
MAPAAIVSDISLPASIPESKVTPANASHAAKFSLSNKTIVITGGGRGLGITLASAVLEAGGNVVCLDVLPEPSKKEYAALQQTATESGLLVSYRNCDITDEIRFEEVMKNIAAEAASTGAPFYGAIACAGIQQKIPAVDYPAADFERILKVNVTGTFLTAKYAAKIMIESGVQGSIVMIASMSGQIANRGLTCSAYNTSKAAVQQMCRSFAQEWGQYGIRVNTLSPGYIRTAMLDGLLATDSTLSDIFMAGAMLNRLGAPDDFKAPAVFLLAPGSSFMTGADLRVDGGHCASA